IVNESGQATRLWLDQLQTMPRAKAVVKEQSGESATYEGVPVVELLERAGLHFGRELRGPRLANYLLVGATDGYRVVFALPELDPALTDQLVLLADCKDGQPLSAKEGPLRIIVPHEKRHARWVRQVRSLRVLSAPPAEKP